MDSNDCLFVDSSHEECGNEMCPDVQEKKQAKKGKILKIIIPEVYFDPEWYAKYKLGKNIGGITFEIVDAPETEQCQKKK